MKKAFTLVELIVVITILAILATIGFVSFSGYLAGARDTNRIAQLKSMSDALELYRTKKDLPIPDDKVDVQASGTTIAYQGYIGANVLETIEYTEKGLDPKDKTYFSYYLTKNKKYFQLLAFLEETNTDVVTGIFNSSQAVDYSARFPKVTGKKLGILIDAENTPIQEITTVTSSGYLDLNDVGTTVYKAIISDEEIISGSGSNISGSSLNGNCKRIKQIKGSSDDGTYTIDPAGDGVGFQVYCDMTTDGGGWTLVDNIANNSDNLPTRNLGANSDINTTKGSLLPAYSWSENPQLLCKAYNYTGAKDWVTFDVLDDKGRDYPILAAFSPGGATGLFGVNTLNGNTNHGVITYIINGIWIGSGSQPNCACGYSANSGLGMYNIITKKCSTWVR